MASTFINLCGYADWTEVQNTLSQNQPRNTDPVQNENDNVPTSITHRREGNCIDLNYDIHIHLPATRDQAVYDALFASLTKHLPLK